MAGEHPDPMVVGVFRWSVARAKEHAKGFLLSVTGLGVVGVLTTNTVLQPHNPEN